MENQNSHKQINFKKFRGLSVSPIQGRKSGSNAIEMGLTTTIITVSENANVITQTLNSNLHGQFYPSVFNPATKEINSIPLANPQSF
jgi:hypothetical protein